MVLSILFLLSKSAIELIDGHLVLKGAVALNKANKDIVVPSLSNIPYQDLKNRKGLFNSVQVDASRTCVFWTDDIDLPSDIIYEYGESLD